MNKNFVLTIGRQLGSGGIAIGKKLSEQLGIAFYDKELIILASKESGLGKEFFEQADEKKSVSFLGGLFNLKSSSNIYDWYSNPLLSNETLFKIQSDIIKELAKKQSCVFVGRCADYILRENPRCVNFFLSADTDERIEFVVRQENTTVEKAKDIIEKTDKKRANYYNYYSNKIWGHSSSYHMCINTSVLGIDESIKFIRNFAEKKLGF